MEGISALNANMSGSILEHNVSSYVNMSDQSYEYNTSSPNDTSEDGYTIVLPPWWQLVIFFLTFITILFIASAGNLIVIWIVLAHKRMRTVTNYFLVNLAIADFLISVLNMVFNFTFMLYQNWWFGSFWCKFSCFISPCTISVSVLTFMAIAIDRYIAIMYPLRPRMPKRHVIAAIIVIWIISIALSLPNLIFAETRSIVQGQNTFVICELTWTIEEDLSYSYLLLVFNYLFPLVTLTVTYTRVGVELWGSRAIGEDTSVQHDRVQSKRKVVKMMIVVVAIFAVCWLPQHIYFLAVNYNPDIGGQPYTQQMYLVIFLMAMSNSMYNPIIYCWMNSRFREGFIRVFCWCPCKPCQVRTRLRFRRTLYPTSAHTISEKYCDRNGSLMHTLTEYVDNDVNGTQRNSRASNSNSSRTVTSKTKQEDYV